MWLSGQQKRPLPPAEGQIGTVVMAGEQLAVQLDSQIRDPHLCAPGGYHWTPAVGDRVLVIRGEGERPCVVGVCGESTPASVALKAEEIDLCGKVSINGISLADYIRQITEGSA